MAKENRVPISSFKVAPSLAAFLEERRKTHPKGFTGIAEECLEAGAILKGYQPPDETGFERVLDNLEDRLTERVTRRIERAIERAKGGRER